MTTNVNVLKQAIQTGESFVLRSTLRGIAKLYTTKEVIQQIGLEYQHLISYHEILADGIEAAVQKAVEQGAQIVIIDEPQRLDSEEDLKQVFRAFEEKGIQVIVAFFDVIHEDPEQELEFNPTLAIRDWIQEQQVPVYNYHYQH